MQLEIFTLCEDATLTDNKLSILRILAGTASPSVPATAPRFFVVVRLRFDFTEEIGHKIDIRVVDPNRGVLDSASLNDSTPAGGSKGRLVTQVVRFDRVVFPRFGDYSVDLLVDGTLLQSIPLELEQTRATP